MSHCKHENTDCLFPNFTKLIGGYYIRIQTCANCKKHFAVAGYGANAILKEVKYNYEKNEWELQQ
jgi:hypothetical protein